MNLNNLELTNEKLQGFTQGELFVPWDDTIIQ